MSPCAARNSWQKRLGSIGGMHRVRERQGLVWAKQIENAAHAVLSHKSSISDSDY